jgi:hypothetical protein
MITEDDEKKLRDKIRKSLDQLEDKDPSLLGTGERPAEDPERASHLEKIVADETDKYFEEKGLKKHISSSGRVYWLTPEEEQGWERHHVHRRKKKKKTRHSLTRKEILFYVFFFLSALIIIIVLFRTTVI